MERIALVDDQPVPDLQTCIQLTWHRAGRQDQTTLQPRHLLLRPPIFSGIQAAIDHVRTHLASGERRIASPSEILARELVVNAVSHRHYGTRYARPVEIDLYTDAVTIASPGPPEPGVDMRGGQFRSTQRRNPELMALLEPLIERPLQRGVGWARAKRAARASGVVLRAEVEHANTVVRLSIDPQRRAEVLDPGDRRHRVPSLAWQEQVLHYLGTRGMARAAAIRDELGLPVSTLRQVLEELESKGLVAPTEEARRSPRQQWMLVRGPF